MRCDPHFEGCADVPGATAETYSAVPADVGHVLAARVTAATEAGSAEAVSNGLRREGENARVRHCPEWPLSMGAGLGSRSECCV